MGAEMRRDTGGGGGTADSAPLQGGGTSVRVCVALTIYPLHPPCPPQPRDAGMLGSTSPKGQTVQVPGVNLWGVGGGEKAIPPRQEQSPSPPPGQSSEPQRRWSQKAAWRRWPCVTNTLGKRGLGPTPTSGALRLIWELLRRGFLASFPALGQGWEGSTGAGPSSALPGWTGHVAGGRAESTPPHQVPPAPQSPAAP